MQLQNNTFKNFVFFLPARLIPAFVGVLVLPFLGKNLSIEDYGKFALSFSLITFLSTLGSSWLSTTIIRFDSIYPRRILNNILLKLSLLSFLVVNVLWLIFNKIYLSKLEINDLYFSGIFWLFTELTFIYITAWLRSSTQTTLYSLLFSLRSLIYFLLIFVCSLNNNFNYKYPIFLYPLSSFISLLVSSKSIVRFLKFPGIINKYNLSKKSIIFRELIQYGTPAAVINVVTILLSLGDRFVIQYYLGESFVAKYSLIYDLSEKSILFINSMFLLATSAEAFKLFDRSSKKESSNLMNLLTRQYLILVSPFLIFVFLAKENILNNLLEPEYFDAISIVPFVILSAFFIGVYHKYTLIITFYKKSYIIMLTSLVALLINIIFSIILIPYFGINGAAISTFIAQFSSLLIYIYFSRKLLKFIFPWKTLLFTLLSSFISVLFFLLLVPFANGYLQELILTIIVVFLMFYASLFLFKEIDVSSIIK